MIVAVNVAGTLVGEGLGRAKTMALATVEDGAITAWEETDVRWDLSHDAVVSGNPAPGELAASQGSHHAKIVRFMRDNHVNLVITGHVGPPMLHTLELMGIPVITGTPGDARAAVLAAVARRG